MGLEGLTKSLKSIMGRFEQEWFQQCWRFAQEWSEKSLIEGGTGIRGACAADALSSFNE